MDYHIIGDIHGQADKLEGLLQHLGYRLVDGVYQQTAVKAAFLGDFIDRGDQHRRVLNIVRPMIEQGYAMGVMGNHEFNAICYHTKHPETLGPLRPHHEYNIKQHQCFLDEYGLHEEDAREIIEWFKTLPVYWEVKDGQGKVLFRMVHACWNRTIVNRVPQYLTQDFIVEASTEGMQAYDDIEVLLKGPEIPLSGDVSFEDKDGHPRRSIRVQWWNEKRPVSYREIAMVPEEVRSNLPSTFVEDADLDRFGYPASEPPVFIGHYWLTGKPVPIRTNVACLDYSAGKGGKLVAYHWREGDQGPLRQERFVAVDGYQAPRMIDGHRVE